MELEKINYSEDTGTQAIQKLDRNQRKIADEPNNLQEQINILSNDRGYLKTKILDVSVDLDEVKDNGIYQVNTGNASNIPVDFGVAYLTVKASSPQFLVQEIVYLNGNYKFYRKCVNGTWVTWEQIVTKSMLNNALAINNLTQV